MVKSLSVLNGDFYSIHAGAVMQLANGEGEWPFDNPRFKARFGPLRGNAWRVDLVANGDSEHTYDLSIEYMEGGQKKCIAGHRLESGRTFEFKVPHRLVAENRFLPTAKVHLLLDLLK